MAKIIWSDPAVSDLEDIHRFIERDSLAHANEFVSRLIEAAESAAVFPQSGKVVRRYPGRDVRQVICGPYRICYVKRGERCEIIGIVHGARDVDAWLNERGNP